MSSVEAVYIFVTDVISVVWFNMVLKRYKKFIKKKKWYREISSSNSISVIHLLFNKLIFYILGLTYKKEGQVL
jgi:membrane associated rhomboid family serine protease